MGWFKKLTGHSFDVGNAVELLTLGAVDDATARRELSRIDDKLNLSEYGREVASFSSQVMTAGMWDVTSRRGAVERLLNPRVVNPEIKTPGVPTYDAARMLVDQQDALRKRRGRAASILSERPSDPLGYTGIAQASATQLLGG